ncbi:hypothetical protein HZ326_24860 [Fusarium oxysporum f. sp. albedinis]|nr:hypothetical protein HZ326_24860 [Fusarium oxysporum f. sp. albedinis]
MAKITHRFLIGGAKASKVAKKDSLSVARDISQSQLPSAIFEVVNIIIINKSPIIIIIGIGTKKSLCFILPAASCPNRLTVVIILLISL